jgi:hypothetical protein
MKVRELKKLILETAIRVLEEGEKEPKKMTPFKAWKEKKPGYTNLGSFQTHLFQSYGVADSGNEKKLADAYPEWFRDEQELREDLEDNTGMDMQVSEEEEITEAKAKKPSAGMTKKEKSAVVKKAKAGEDIGKKGKGFEKVAKAAGGGEKGEKIAAAAMWKSQAKKK